MEHNGSGSSEHPNLPSDVTSIIKDEDPHDIDNDKLVNCPSSSSSSSHLEIDIGEDEMTFSEFEEISPSSARSNPESPITIIASPLAPGFSLSPQTRDSNTLSASPKQSPPIQVMGYDSDNIPSPVFALKHRNDSDMSLASNESLFSIHMGTNSFSMDNGFSISKSGELNWIDDYSCLTPDANNSSLSPGLPTGADTSAENERKSANTNSESSKNEELLETQSDLATSPTHNSANITCLSDASCQSTSSFAFPVLAGGGSPSPTKLDAEPSLSTPPAEAQTTPKAHSTIPKAGGNQWFHCFSCFPMCC